MSAKLYTDGGSRGNPGLSAAAYILKDENDLVMAQHSELIGIATNNESEYHALVEGLIKALEMGAFELVVYSDSMLMVEQMKENWKVKNGRLSELRDQAQKAANLFHSIEFIHIPREENAEADRLVNEAFSWH